MSDNEIIDIINKKDEVIGKSTKEKCHNDPYLIHRTVHFTLFSTKTNKILLTQYPLKKSHDAGRFCFLGEHILSGESYKQAVYRGILEELGVKTTNYEEFATNIFSYDRQTELVKFFVSRCRNTHLVLDKSEIEKVIWISYEELLNNKYDISEMTRYWIKNVNWKLVFSKN